MTKFDSVWETLHPTIPDEQRSGAIDPEKTIVPSDDAGRKLDFSLVTLPRLTAGGVGAALAPQIELGPTIGKGGMAIVHLARQVPLQRDVAVKALRPEMRSPESTRVLLSEAWVTGLLEHPNIVPVYELGQDETGSPLMVMKCIGGTSWREFLRNPGAHRDKFGKQTPLEWNLGILTQVCNAVHYAHSKGIIHRDLKPDNVMIGEFGEVYLLDWGLAVAAEESPAAERFPAAKRVDAIAGTPGYMAPEMVDFGRRAISIRTDIYLLGAILHEVLAGAPRHSGRTLFDVMYSAFHSKPHEYAADLPAELAAIANRATHVSPEARFATAEELKQAILEYLEHRESAELAREAASRLRSMESQIARTLAALTAKPEEALELNRTFAEARFGFQQALRLWPENERARTGLESSLRLMAEHELRRGDYDAAALLIAELRDVSPELRARLETLRLKKDEEQARFARLEKLEKDVDVGVAARARARMMFAFAAIWSALPFATAYVTKTGLITVTYQSYILQSASFGAILLGAIWVGRRTFLRNEANRRIMSAALYIFTAVVAHRILCYGMDLPYSSAVTQELHLYFLSMGLAAITLDRRIGYAAVAYLVCAFGATIQREYFLEWHGIANLTALSLIGLVWKYGKAEPR